MKQTAVEWLVNRWKKLQAKGEKMSWNQIIQITELAKEVSFPPIELPSDEDIDMAQQSKIGNSDNSQTAMQEFIEWAISLKDKEQQCIDWICIKSKAEDLLTKEKEQIINACIRFGNLNGVDIEDYEEYYNEYYGK